ncbi:MAG: transglutaminase domain-containing protein [Candidatus Paceibacterota bacterium]
MVLFFFLACALAFGQDMTVGAMAPPPKPVLGPHLKPLGTVIFQQRVRYPANGVTKIEVWNTVPPETATQKNVKIVSAQLHSLDGTPVPEGAVQRYDVPLLGSEGQVPGFVLVWKGKDGDTSLSRGVYVDIQYSCEMYAATVPQTDGPERPGGEYLLATKYMDFSAPSSGLRSFLGGLPLGVGTNSLELDAAAMRSIAQVGYVKKATSASNAFGGTDCLGKSSLLGSALRKAGVPTRTIMGHLIRPDTLQMDQHTRVERLFRGWWLPVEPTDVLSAQQPQSFIGTNGKTSYHFFTLHFGAGLAGTFVDQDQQTHKLDVLGLQWSFIRLSGPKGASTNASGIQKDWRVMAG